MVVSDEQYPKAPSPMELTDSGMTTVSSFEHVLKVYMSIKVTDVGMTTDTRDEHP